MDLEPGKPFVISRAALGSRQRHKPQPEPAAQLCVRYCDTLLSCICAGGNRSCLSNTSLDANTHVSLSPVQLDRIPRKSRMMQLVEVNLSIWHIGCFCLAFTSFLLASVGSPALVSFHLFDNATERIAIWRLSAATIRLYCRRSSLPRLLTFYKTVCDRSASSTPPSRTGCRRLEEQYSTGLRRLARNKLEDADLGIFSVPWDALTDSANTLADSHFALASKIEVDVERPLREFVSSNRSMTGLTTTTGNLRSMVKDVDAVQARIDRLQAKGERLESSRMAEVNRELEETNAQWQSQAPYVFANLQEMDETRLNNLRDVLTQFQTHEVDLVEQNRRTAEHCLNVLLQVETADEIKTFAIKAVSTRPRTQRSTGGFATAAGGAPPFSRGMLAPASSTPDDESQRSGSVQEEKKKNRFSAITRMGTTLGRRSKRESKLPETASSTDESSEKKSRSGPFSMGKKNKSRIGGSQLETPQEEEDSEVFGRTRSRPSMPPQIGSEVLDLPIEPSNPTASATTERSEVPPNVNGTTLSILNGNDQSGSTVREPPRASQREAPEVSRSAGTKPVEDSEGYSLPSRGLDPISAAQQEAEAAGEGSSPAFNVNIRDAPVPDTAAGSDAALATIASKLGPPVISRAGTVRGRRQANRNSVAMSATNSAYIPETPPAPLPNDSRAPAPLSSDVTMPAVSAPAFQHPSRSTSIPVASASITQSAIATAPMDQLAASTFSPFASPGQIPTVRPDSRTAVGSDHAGTDDQSVRSGRSLNSTVSQGTRHPELHNIGLNSSIVETVSARFENGAVVSESVIGEVALVYNSADPSSLSGTRNIRLENFGSLEKVAPNPAFVNPRSAEQDGVYAVDLSKLARTQIAFKYQIRTASPGSHSPLLLTTAYKLEPTQASIIVSCSLNPAFALHGQDSVTLSNVVVGLTLDGPPASSCLSKPTGTFVRERNVIAWQIPEITLKTGADPEKFLARFKTDSEAKGGSVEARWEVTGEHAVSLAGRGGRLAVSLQSNAADAKEGADPFADASMVAGAAGNWKACATSLKLISGVYGAK
nr:suppressor of profilin deletion [Quercus suber]